MEDDKWGCLFSAFLFIIAPIFLLVALGSYSLGYESGQIDAANGIQKFEKITHENQTVTWEEIKEVEKWKKTE